MVSTGKGGIKCLAITTSRFCDPLRLFLPRLKISRYFAAVVARAAHSNDESLWISGREAAGADDARISSTLSGPCPPDNPPWQTTRVTWLTARRCTGARSTGNQEGMGSL
ncbi:MAG: hypothetical protein CM15mP92_1620 [Halieaceae bacterium]|nr:MAG: hypothetical protein CM15mP92_1620 [Halieaceae bacterium]